MKQSEAVAELRGWLSVPQGPSPKHAEFLLHHVQGPFSLTEEQEHRVQAWLAEGKAEGLKRQADAITELRSRRTTRAPCLWPHDCTCGLSDQEHEDAEELDLYLDLLESCQDSDVYYTGTIACGPKYTFLPTSVGTMITVEDERLGRKLELDEQFG